MSEKNDSLIKALEPFGLHELEAKIYLVLLERGQLSALEISRHVGVSRSKVYRILDSLIATRLVIQKHDERGFKFVAAEVETLSQVVEGKLAYWEKLQAKIPDVMKELELVRTRGKSGSRVLYYRGKRGLSQVNWNLLRAKGELLSFEVANLDAYMDHAEAEKLRRELVEEKILVRTITNLERIEPFTEVKELVEKWWEIRSISKEVIDIRADVFIYNNVYALCHYLEGGDVFCVEIENEHLARMQREMFEVMWGQAKKMRKVGSEGEAVVGVNE